MASDCHHSGVSQHVEARILSGCDHLRVVAGTASSRSSQRRSRMHRGYGDCSRLDHAWIWSESWVVAPVTSGM